MDLVLYISLQVNFYCIFYHSFTPWLSELTKCLEKFTMEETSKLYDSNGDEAVMAVKNGDVDTEKLIQQWTKAYKQVGTYECRVASFILQNPILFCYTV